MLHTTAGTVPGSNLVPGPAYAPGPGTVRYHQDTYRSYGFTGTAFPSNGLQVSLLVR